MKLIVKNHAICFDSCYGVYNLKYGPHNEKTVCFEPQEQASNAAVVTPNKGKAGKRTEKPLII